MEEKPPVKLTIDGFEVSVAPGSTIIQAAQKIEKYIPYFCYHPGLSVVGQCRMCFVEIEGAPKLATACSTPVSEGMKVLTDTPKVKSGQNATLEFTLLNHPLDCPICDRGGECKLQDYTYDFGPPLSRMVDDKKLKDKHRAISDQVVLDQERCILCTRCVRFSSEVDGKAEITVNERGSASVVDVFEGRPMTSKFSGNVVDICPVGALTAKDFRFAARPWELKRHEAICTGCAVGCNIEIHTKNRNPGIARPDHLMPIPQVVRLMPRDNMEVNTWWLCDKGRWGYHFHNEDENRLHLPQIKRTILGKPEEVSLREISVFIEEASKKHTAPWEFWIDDNLPHEGIAWAKELHASWKSRGRSVAPTFNPSPQSDAFLKFWSSRMPSPWTAGAAEWAQIKTVLSPFDYRELEDIAPILALRLGQSLRKGQIKFEKVSVAEMASHKSDVLSTAYLVSPPQNAEDIAAIAKLPSESKVLPLFTQANSRGLLNEGIAPIETLAATLKGQRAQAPIFFFSQRTQNELPKSLVEYLSTSPFLIVADSFKSVLSEKASVVLPLTPLYESQSTLTNLENRRQISKGIRIQHPNIEELHRGGPLVNPSLRLI